MHAHVQTHRRTRMHACILIYIHSFLDKTESSKTSQIEEEAQFAIRSAVQLHRVWGSLVWALGALGYISRNLCTDSTTPLPKLQAYAQPLNPEP